MAYRPPELAGHNPPPGHKSVYSLGYTEEDFDSLLEQAESMAETDWEIEFIQSLLGRWRRYKMKTFLSDKQVESLEKIVGEL